MSTDKAMETDANLRSIIHNALIDGPRLEDDTTAAFNGLVELLHDRISAALAQAEQPVAGYLHRLTVTEDWNISLPSQMESAWAYRASWPDRIEIIPLFAHPPAKREAGETPAPESHLEGSDNG